jgi:hypothetical protein
VTDAATKRQSDAAPTVRVQVRVLAVRFMPQPSADADFALPAASDEATTTAGSSLLPAVSDLSRQIRARGVRARAPPSRFA